MGIKKNLDKEIIIKSKERVENHGEVFTPKRIVNEMLNLPGVKEACKNVKATFLEPACGEGAFLLKILKRKLKMIEKKYNKTLEEYENYSLLGLSTLYGIEILEDNVQECVMKMYDIFLRYYKKQVIKHGKSEKKNVRKSARFIISKNIILGNFLTKKFLNGSPIIFNEWKPENISKSPKDIIIQRTEYTLDEIYDNIEKESGDILSSNGGVEQLSMLDMEEEQEGREYKYKLIKITHIYKEEMEDKDDKSD